MNHKLTQLTLLPDEYANGADSMALLETPFCLASAPKAAKHVVVIDVERRIEITPNPTHGYPGLLEEEVLLALIQLTIEGLFRDRQIEFTLTQLAKKLRLSQAAENIESLARALRRLRWTSYELFQSWWDKDSSKYTTESDFAFFSGIRIRKREVVDGGTQYLRCHITWHERFFDSLKRLHMKPLDWSTFTSIRTGASRKLYRILDQQFVDDTTTCRFEIRDLACNRLGYAADLPTKKLNERLKQPISRLKAARILEHAAIEQEKKGAPMFLRFREHPERTQARLVDPDQQQPLSAEQNALRAELRRLGIARSASDELVRAYDPAEIRKQIDFLEFRLERADEIPNPGGYLNRAIREDYSAPKGYVSKADRLKAQEKATLVKAILQHQGKTTVDRKGATFQVEDGYLYGDRGMVNLHELSVEALKRILANLSAATEP